MGERVGWLLKDVLTVLSNLVMPERESPMSEITAHVLNDLGYSALTEGLNDQPRRLHGLQIPCLHPGISLMLWPYGELLRPFETTYKSRCDQDFRKGSRSLNGLLSNYLRSCQLLGLAISRYKDSMENRQRLRKAAGGKPFTVPSDMEAAFGEFHTDIDVSVHLDSCVSYLKILADMVAKTLPSLFGDPPPHSSTPSSPRDSINTLWNHASNQPTGTALKDVFHTTPRDWLDILSTSRKRPAGIRDARFHQGAVNHVSLASDGNGPWRVHIQQSSVENIHIYPDMISKMCESSFGFFSFLDHVVREAITRDPILTPSRESYWGRGYQLVFGPTAFLGSVIPTA
jgi:hypothetical protein